MTPCVDRIDYRIRLVGIPSSHVRKVFATEDFQEHADLRIRMYRNVTIIRFYRNCHPFEVEAVWNWLLQAFCPDINAGLLTSFEMLAASRGELTPDVLEEAIA